MLNKKKETYEKEMEQLYAEVAQLKKMNQEQEKELDSCRKKIDDSYRNYPKIDFLTRVYSYLLRDIKKQMDAVVLATKYASEHVIRNDIDMMDTEALMARSLSRVLKMTDKEIADEIQNIIMEDVDSGTLTFYDADEFNSSRDYGFRNNRLIREIMLPEGIQTIKRGFFYGCTNLREVHIPSSVEHISDYAFFGCASLEKVEFDDNSRLEEIGEYAFSSCRNLEQIELPQKIRIIQTAAFRECDSLRSVIIHGDNLEKLGNHVFQYCRKLRDFVIPGKMSVLQTSLFNGCSELHEMTIPQNVELVMDYVFRDCSGLKRIVFESDKTTVSGFAFEGVPQELSIVVNGCSLEKIPVLDHSVQAGSLLDNQES